MITVLAGGVGAARLLGGLVRVVPPHDVTAIVNVGDDLVLHGLRICPDLDTIVYTLAGANDVDRGWGLADESWQAMDMLRHLGGEAWFNLGDRDIGTHLYRTQRLDEGIDLTTVTAEIAKAWGLDLTLLPVTNDDLRTRVTLAEEGGAEVTFQEYFVKRHHDVAVSSLRFEGAEAAHPGDGVIDAIDAGAPLIIAPSNPFVSIDPVLAVRGVRDTVQRHREHTVAVAPIVAGAALKGPADRLMGELGHETSVVGIARLYAPLAAALVVDHADAALANEVEAAGMRCVVTDTIMRGPDEAAALARVVLESA
jgi:LPPG:FO 2-phospho-L-lactate transferase